MGYGEGMEGAKMKGVGNSTQAVASILQDTQELVFGLLYVGCISEEAYDIGRH